MNYKFFTFLLLFNLFIPLEVNSSMQDSYKKNNANSNACNINSAKFEKTIPSKTVTGLRTVTIPEYKKYFCVLKNGTIMAFPAYPEASGGVKPATEFGKIGKTQYEKPRFAGDPGSRIEYFVEGSNLVRYKCSGYYSCETKPYKIIYATKKEVGTKIGINNLKKTTNNYQTLLFKGVGKYVGEVKDGQMNGNGTFTWEDGNEYTGGFKNGLFEGKGTMSYTSGNKITVNFKGGRKEGLGKYIYKNGAVLEVPYINDEPEGIGVYTDENGTIRKGTWSKGKFVKWN